MPVGGKIRIPLTIESILAKVNEYDIYRYYIGQDFRLGTAFISPFRKEANPSFCINVNKVDRLHHIDFADSSKSGDCVGIVMQLYGLTYHEALLRIDKDMNLGITGRIGVGRPIRFVSPEMIVKKESIIHVITRRFTEEELGYWNLYHIGEQELKDNHVYAIKSVFFNRKRFPMPSSELAFAYYFPEVEKWKIYRPYAVKKQKWRPNNVPNDHMSGLHKIVQGCEVAVVTKSKKDEIVLAKFLPHVCSAQTESEISINGQNISFLKGNCGKVYLNFDSDEVGVQACKFYNQFGFGWVNCPRGLYDTSGRMIKDFADLARYHSLERVVEHFKTKGII